MVYAKRADPLPWHIVKAQESSREAVARKEVERALKNASDKLKQDKLQTLERLREVRRTAAQVLQDEADRIAGDHVLNELLDECASDSDTEEDDPTAKGGGSNSRGELPPTVTTARGTTLQCQNEEMSKCPTDPKSAQIGQIVEVCMATERANGDQLAPSQGTFRSVGEPASAGSEGTPSPATQQAAASRQHLPLNSARDAAREAGRSLTPREQQLERANGTTAKGGGECSEQTSPPNTLSPPGIATLESSTSAPQLALNWTTSCNRC
jgi:hypothetical protein